MAATAVKFGTDGWRGVIAADFTFERLVQVAPVAAQVLQQTYGESDSRLIVVGYDRRFLAEEFAEATAKSVAAAGFDVLLADTFAPTPALSWAVKQQQALGALVITASHNPGSYLGLKVKGAFGGSVPGSVTQAIEAQLQNRLSQQSSAGQVRSFNPWTDYCQVLRSKVDLPAIQQAITAQQLTVFVDVMHGATATGLGQVLGEPAAHCVRELHSDRDPLFGGFPPEPLPHHLTELSQALQQHQSAGVALGLVFDGDGDRIAAMDGAGNFLSSQVLIPILIDHLAGHRHLSGEVIKTISGLDLFPRVAELHGLPVYETPIGYKYIADRMLSTGQALLGGEESGGIGYGNHIPERDGLLSALYLLEALTVTGKDLSQLFQALQERTGYTSFYDRIDLPLASLEVQAALNQQLCTQPPREILGQAVVDLQTQDGFKFRLADQSWLLIRFSGTEPVLRLYSEGGSAEQVAAILGWAKDWATS